VPSCTALVARSDMSVAVPLLARRLREHMCPARRSGCRTAVTPGLPGCRSPLPGCRS